MSDERITLRDIYDAVNRLEDKLSKRIDGQDKKIERLEGFQNKALGIISIIMLLFSSLVTYFWNRVLPKD
jgi:hypothetical protein